MRGWLSLSVFCAVLWAFPARSERRYVEIQPGVARPGDLVIVRAYGADAPPTGKLGSTTLTFHAHLGGYIALTGLSVDLPLTPLPFSVTFPDKDKDKKPSQTFDGELELVDPQFRAREQLRVATKFVAPSKREKKRMKEDRDAFARAFAQKERPPLFTENFDWPRRDYLTGLFGDRRLFNGKQTSQHYGVDMDGEVGDSIYATNDGEAVLVRDCFASGLTVVLYHGAQLYTAYFHLSKTDIKQGDKVKRGQRLGSVGRSGRVTGPHLHWGVKVDGNYINGETLVLGDFT